MSCTKTSFFFLFVFFSLVFFFVSVSASVLCMTFYGGHRAPDTANTNNNNNINRNSNQQRSQASEEKDEQLALECTFCEESIADAGNKLYYCTHRKCMWKKSGKLYCIPCGQAMHRRKNHGFEDGLPHIQHIVFTPEPTPTATPRVGVVRSKGESDSNGKPGEPGDPEQKKCSDCNTSIDILDLYYCNHHKCPADIRRRLYCLECGYRRHRSQKHKFREELPHIIRVPFVQMAPITSPGTDTAGNGQESESEEEDDVGGPGAGGGSSSTASKSNSNPNSNSNSNSNTNSKPQLPVCSFCRKNILKIDLFYCTNSDCEDYMSVWCLEHGQFRHNSDESDHKFEEHLPHIGKVSERYRVSVSRMETAIQKHNEKKYLQYTFAHQSLCCVYV